MNINLICILTVVWIAGLIWFILLMSGATRAKRVNETKKIQKINKPRRVSSLPMHTFSNLKTPGWNWGRVYT